MNERILTTQKNNPLIQQQKLYTYFSLFLIWDSCFTIYVSQRLSQFNFQYENQNIPTLKMFISVSFDFLKNNLIMRKK